MCRTIFYEILHFCKRRNRKYFEYVRHNVRKRERCKSDNIFSSLKVLVNVCAGGVDLCRQREREKDRKKKVSSAAATACAGRGGRGGRETAVKTRTRKEKELVRIGVNEVTYKIGQ